MTTNWTQTIMTIVSCGAVLFGPRQASACGGEFGPPPQPGAVATPVTGHRMAFAVSDERTVLWDQIKYRGAPEDFSWVLPVRPGAVLEESRDSWFESLDALTTTRVSAPILRCVTPDSSSGCGCAFAGGGDDDDTATGGGTRDSGVTVLSEGTVGPYETVTLRSTDGDTLTTWLDEHGYAVPDDVGPIVAEYVAEGFDFIALRLRPESGVKQMTPVRVVTPGPRGALPLRMVAAGVGSEVAITLYLIGETRLSLPDLHEAQFPLDELSWDFATSETNYATLEARALGESFGASYLTTFADWGAFAKQYQDADGRPIKYDVSFSPSQPRTFASLYFLQSRIGTPNGTNCPPIEDLLASPTIVSADGADGTLAASSFSCGGADDIAAAVTGMHPSNVWLTRLEMNLPRSALSADCVVEPNADEAPVSNTVRATRFSHQRSDCVLPLFETSFFTLSRSECGLWLSAVALGLVTRLRRRGTAR